MSGENRAFHEPEVSNFGVARIGGVPVHRLDACVLRGSQRIAGRLADLRRELRLLSETISDELFRLVGSGSLDRDTRRTVLAVRRHVHNCVEPDPVEQAMPTIQSHVGETDLHEHLTRWIALAAQGMALEDELRLTYQAELETANGAVAAAASQEDFQGALALASTALLHAVQAALPSARPEDWSPATKLGRSTFAYLSRAATKTSPFSTFTTVAEARFGDVPLPRAERRGEPRRVVALNQVLQYAGRHRSPGDPDRLWGVNPSLRLEPGKPLRVSLLRRRVRILQGLGWTEEESVTATLPLGESAELSNLLEPGTVRSWRDWRDALRSQGMGEEVLVRAGILTPVLADEWAQQVPVALMGGCPAARSRALEELSTDAARLVASEPIETTGRGLQVAFEDVGFPSQAVTVPLSTLDEVASALSQVSRRVIRSLLYEYLYSFFLLRHGTDGRCTDVLGFLHAFMTQAGASELIARSIAEDSWEIENGGSEAHRPVTGRTSAPPSVAAFFQVAATSPEALERGEYLVVLNQVNPGHVGLLARFLPPLPNDGMELRAAIERWIGESVPGAEPVEFVLNADVSNLQRPKGLFGRLTTWPSDLLSAPPGKRKTLPFSDLTLRASSDTRTLEFLDPAGHPVAPTYTGVTSAHLVGGERRLFLTLADPWNSDYQTGWYLGRLHHGLRPTDCMVTYPREQVGRLVLRRARWRCPVAQVPVPGPGEPDWRFFARVQEWREQHGIPEEVFAIAETTELTTDQGLRKPVWVHFASPHSLQGLLSLRRTGVHAIALTEALPSRRECWLDPGAGRRASEFLVLGRWREPAPRADEPPRGVRPAAPEAGPGWLYFRLYPDRADQLDAVVCDVLPSLLARARELSSVTDWFYLRFVDEGGAHVRFRCRVDPRQFRACFAALRDAAADGLSKLSRVDRGGRPALWPAGAPPGDQSRRVVPTRYSPELVRFGGAEGLHLAHEVFRASSDCALGLLQRGPKVAPERWLAIAIRHMLDVVDVFYTGLPAKRLFLMHYMRFWAAPWLPDAERRQRELQERAAQLVPVVRAALDNLESSMDRPPRSANYPDAVARVRPEFTAPGILLDRPERLALDFIHLHNNRLGFAALEEALLAAVARSIIRGNDLALGSPGQVSG